jgi:hypothetical protein
MDGHGIGIPRLACPSLDALRARRAEDAVDPPDDPATLRMRFPSVYREQAKQ